MQPPMVFLVVQAWPELDVQGQVKAKLYLSWYHQLCTVLEASDTQ